MVIASVGSAVSPVGTAAAASETYQFNGSPEIVAVNVTGASGDVTVEFSTEGGPASGSQVIAKTTVDATSTTSPEVALANLGAYDSVNATVTGTGVSNLSTAEYGGRLVMPSDQITMLGGTGGDKDLHCGISEKVARAVDSQFTQLDCVAQPGSYSVNTSQTDLSQIKLDIYQAGLNQEAAENNANATLSNYLTDTKTTAQIKAKNAYIRELNNGSSKSAAQTGANQTVQDYYSVKQKNLINRWNAGIENFRHQDNISESEGANIHYVDVKAEDPDSGTPQFKEYDTTNNFGANVTSYGSETLTLANGSTMSATTVTVTVTYADVHSNTYTIGLTDGAVIDASADGSYTNDNQVTDLRRLVVQDSLAEADGEANMIVFNDYSALWTEIQSQSSNTRAELKTVVDGTYSAYQQGDINNTDLVDPYTLSAEYSPGSEYQGWAAAQLTLLGQNNPDAMESIGYMNVTDETDNTSYQGVLMSPSNPSSGEFAVNSTYDASTLSGQQYVVTDSQIHELTGNFTLTAAQTHSGESVQNVTMYEKQYTTTNVTELQQLYDDLSKTRAEIEAREQNLLSSGGGGLLGSSSTLALVAIAGGAIYLLGREDRGDP